jgi:hypothetical protein
MLLQHVELSHNDGDSPFAVRNTSPAAISRRPGSRGSSHSNRGSHSRSGSITPLQDDDVYVECPLRCGEAIHIRELDDHMDLHDIEALNLDDLDGTPSSSRNASPRPPSRSRTSSSGSKHGLYAPENTGDHLTIPESSHKKHRHKVRPLDGLKDLFVGPASNKTRHSEPGVKMGGIKRLGVSFEQGL